MLHNFFIKGRDNLLAARNACRDRRGGHAVGAHKGEKFCVSLALAKIFVLQQKADPHKLAVEIGARFSWIEGAGNFVKFMAR